MEEIEVVPAEAAEESTNTPEVQDNSIRATLEREFNRDESGRFTAKQEQKISDPTDTVVKAEPATPAITPPQSWSADKKELFKTLPRDLQDYILQRDRETSTLISQKSDRAARYDKWEGIEKEVGTVLADKLKAMGLSPHDAVKHLVNAQAEMDRNPIQTLQKIAQSYGLIPGGNPQAAPNPQIAEIQQRLNSITQQLQSRQNADIEMQLKTLESQVAEWSKDKEHYDAVWEVMGNYLPLFAGKMSHAEALDKAYAHAIHDNPEISQALAQKAEAQKIQEQKARAEKARRTGATSLPSSSSNSTTQLPASDRRGMIAALFDQKI